MTVYEFNIEWYDKYNDTSYSEESYKPSLEEANTYRDWCLKQSDILNHLTISKVKITPPKNKEILCNIMNKVAYVIESKKIFEYNKD